MKSSKPQSGYRHENRDEGCSKYAMDLAARKGHLDIVIWLHVRTMNNGITIDFCDDRIISPRYFFGSCDPELSVSVELSLN